MLACSGASMNEVWVKAATALLSPEASVVKSRGGRAHELMHVVLRVEDPRQRWVLARQPAINPAFALAEVIWILGGRDDTALLSHWFPRYRDYVGGGDFQHAAYGARLRRGLGDLDQLRRAAAALRANPDSRQVVLQIWSAGSDLPNDDGSPVSGDVPCNLTSCLKVRDGQLHWLQTLRSNDIDRGLPHNAVQFTMLQQVVAGWVGVGLGEYVHVADSLHWYEAASSRLSIDDQVTPVPDTSTFAEPPEETDRIVGELLSWMDSLRGTATPLTAVMDEPSRLPPSYENIRLVLAADHLRRSRRQDLAAELIGRCTNEAYRQLWERWVLSVSAKTARHRKPDEMITGDGLGLR